MIEYRMSEAGIIQHLDDLINQFKLTDGGINGKKKCGDANELNADIWFNNDFQRLLTIIPVLYTQSDTRVGISSYKLKHEIEKILGTYMPSGMVILAFMYLGYEVSPRYSPNACIKVQYIPLTAGHGEALLKFHKSMSII